MSLRRSLGVVLLSTAAASAATITSFSATPGGAALNFFTSVTINATLTGNTANITQSGVDCTSGMACNGRVADFEIKGTGLTTTTPIVVTIDGSYTDSNLQSMTGEVSLQDAHTPEAFGFPFLVSPGSSPYDFSQTIVSFTAGDLATGNFDITGALSLSMPAGSTINLPNSLSITIGAPSGVPEPSSILLLLAGLVPIGLTKWRKRRC